MSSNRVGERNTRPNLLSLAFSCSSWNSLIARSFSSEIRSIRRTCARRACWSWREREVVVESTEMRRSGCDVDGWEMLTAREEEEEETRRGRWRVLVAGSQRFGAIMNSPWLHTAFARSKLGSFFNASSITTSPFPSPIFLSPLSLMSLA